MAYFHESGDGRVCLATTSYAAPDAGYTHAMAGTREALDKAGISSRYFLLEGNCHVDDARNDIVQRFLATDCSDLIFIDADVSWSPEQVVELMDYNCDIVGGVYPFRREDKQMDMPVRMLPGAKPANGLLEVDGLPTGFMRIRRRVLEALAADSPSYKSKNGEDMPIVFERTLIDGTRWGGDLNFCNKWRERGGQIFAVYEMELGHAAKIVYSNSIGAFIRSKENSTLYHVCEKIKAGTETADDINEARRHVANVWGAQYDVIATAIALARQAKGPIIESGSGLTTILMAAATDEIVYCLEHHPVHMAKLRQMSGESGVTNIGLCPCPIKDGWYDISDLDLPHHFAFGLNDGPPRAIGDRMRFFDHFSPDIVLCDDVDDVAYADKLTSLGMGFDRVGLRAGILNLKKAA